MKTSEAQVGPSQTSKMDSFATIVTKLSILNPAWTSGLPRGLLGFRDISTAKNFHTRKSGEITVFFQWSLLKTVKNEEKNITLHKDNISWSTSLSEKCFSVFLRVVFSTHDGAFSRKLLTAKNRYFSVKRSIIDVPMVPKYTS